MTAWVKVAGVWRTLTPRAKVGGSWRSLNGGFVKVAGVWRKFYPATGAIVLGSSTINSSTGAKAASVTGKAGSFLAAMVVVTNQTAANGTITDSTGGTWGPMVSANNSAPNRSCAIWLRNEPMVDGSAVVVTYTPSTAGSTADGGGLTVVRLDGFGGAYPNAIQWKGVSDPLDGVPTVTLDSGVDANSALLAVTCSTNRAPAAPSGFVNHYSSSYFTPSLFASTSSRDFGQVSNVIQWGTLSATGWCACALEVKP